MSNASDKATWAIVEEANEWLVRLQDPAAGLGDAAKFTEWLHRSPVHVREYLRAESTWAALGDIDEGRRIDIDGLLNGGDCNVVTFETSAANGTDSADNDARGRWFTRRPRFGEFGAAVAAVLAVLLGGFWYTQQTQPTLYETGRGEQRRLVLEDGSVVELNTQSAIAVRLSDTQRHIEFRLGEALFTVAKDPDRPFVVESDLAVVRAIGTQFNVYRQADHVLVTVLEGRVAVENMEPVDNTPMGGAVDIPAPRVELAAGDRAEIVAHAPIRTTMANKERTVAWTERRLIFENNQLSEIIGEFNRYNKRQMIIEDTVLSTQRISGVFDADQPDALIRFLTQNGTVETLEKSRTELVIRPRR